jgi:hydroxypyruvate isomerase
MSWTLRYAPHLGYRPPFEPLWRASVGSSDPLAHVQFAADQGFAGVLYAAARGRPVAEQEAVGAALARLGLEAGCILYTTFDKLRAPLWCHTGPVARAQIATELAAAIEVAQRIGARRLAILGGADPNQPMAAQHAAFAENLRFAADIAEPAGMVLCLETINRASVPGMLLHHIADAHAIVHAVNRPSVRLIFDTAHVQAMDGDVLRHLEATWEAIEIVQIAEHPGRTEPGTGEINFDGVFELLARRGYRGLVEVEHGWLEPGPDSERRGLTNLRRLDGVAARMVQPRLNLTQVIPANAGIHTQNAPPVDPGVRRDDI